MRSPSKPRARAVLVFVLAAVCTGVSALAIAWIGSRSFGEGGLRSKTLPSQKATFSSDTFRRLLSGALLTGEECRRGVESLSEANVRELLRIQDAAFWRSNPNAAMLLRQAGAVLAKGASADTLLADITALLAAAKAEPGTLQRLLAATLAGALETRAVSSAEIVEIMRKSPPSAAIALLETWLDFQPPTSVQSDLAAALSLAAQAFPQSDEKLRDDVRAMVVRVWAHRAPPVADALLFAKQMEDLKRGDLEMRLLSEGARLVAVTQPTELGRQFAQFGPMWPGPAGQVAADSGLSFEQARMLAAGMQPKASEEFLGTFVRSLAGADPREMSKLATGHTPGDFPPAVAATVGKGLMTTSDFGQMDAWLGSMDSAAQAKLLDQSLRMDFSGQGPGVSACRYYLERRPASLPPNIGCLNQIAWQTPLEHITEIQPWIDSLPNSDRVDVQDNIYQRELAAAISRGDEDSFALLDKLSERGRSDALSIVFGQPNRLGSDSAREIAQRWLEDAAGDPKLQANIAEPLIRSSLATGDLDTAEALAWRLAGSDLPVEAVAEKFDRVVRAATSRDSSRGAAMVERLPAGELRDQVLTTFTRQWAELDPVSAADWLAEQPAGPGRDHATKELVACSRSDPESALTNAAGIRDPKLRMEAARSVLRLWRDIDPAQAAAILPGAGFPPEELPALRGLLGLVPDRANASQR